MSERTFHWVTKRTGLFSRETSGWALENGPHRTPSDGATAAHDLFHHLPGETGTYQEEVRSLGAEAWLDQVQADWEMELKTNWFSILAMTLEDGTRGVRGLALPEAIAAPSALDAAMATQWREAYLSGVAEAREEFGDWGSAAEWGAIVTPGAIASALALMEEGYNLAALRFPDANAARADYLVLAELAKHGSAEEVIRVTEQDGRVQAQKVPFAATRKPRP